MNTPDADILRGITRCATCTKRMPPNSARAILYLSPAKYAIACLDCAKSEAGLNNELVKLPNLALRP